MPAYLLMFRRTRPIGLRRLCVLRRRFAAVLMVGLFFPQSLLPTSATAHPAAKGQTESQTASQPDAASEQLSSAARPQPKRLKPLTPRFRQATDAMRTHVTKMRETVVLYNTSRELKSDNELKNRWWELQTEGHAKYAEMLAAALEEYRAEMATREQIEELLYIAVDENIENDEFEGMLPIAQTLLENDYPDSKLLLHAGLAAYATNDFDTAATLIQQIVDTGKASPTFIAVNEKMGEVRQAWERELEARKQDAAGEPLPRLLMRTTKGDVEIELFENQAPETVGNFIHLVEQGFYDRLTFHRVLTHFMAQTGCPHGDGSGDAGYTIYNEADRPDARKFFRGTLGMALAQNPNSGGSQFFITYLPTEHLNGTYTAFGRVTKGMQVIANLNRINPDEKDKKEEAVMPDEIREIEVLYKRDHAYVPNKVKK